MNTSRLQLIIEDLIEATRVTDYKKLELLGELVEEISCTYNAPSNWRELGSNLEELYREDREIYHYMNLSDFE